MPAENLIQRGDLLQRLLRGLEIKGQRAAALALDPTVVPTVVLEDLTRQGISRDPLGRHAYFASGNIAAVAAQFAHACVFNPVGSGVLLIINGFHVAPGTTGQAQFGLIDPAALPATIGLPVWTDPRNSGIPSAHARLGTDPALRIVTELMRINCGSTTLGAPPVWPPDFNLVVVEGTGFGCAWTTVNQAAAFSFTWEEVQHE